MRSSPEGGGRGALRRLGWLLVLGGASAALFVLALDQSFTSALSSDGASNVLQAESMVHGNPLLRGWWTSDVSFYSTELPEYALVTAVRGVTAGVVHICGALTYTLTVLLAALVAYGGPGRVRASRRVRLAGAGIAIGILLAPSVLGGTEVFVENPDHAGTAVPVLALLLVIDRMRAGPAPRWYLPVTVCVLLALAQFGDELALAAATVPVAMVSALRLAASAGPVLRGGGRLPRGDVLLLGAAVVATVAVRCAGLVFRSLGGFDQRPIPAGLLAPLGQVPGHARVLGPALALIFGANNPGVPRRPITRAWHPELVAMADLHVIGLVLAAAGLVAGISAIFSRRADRGDRVTQVLAVAILTVLGAGLFGTLLRSLSAAHEVAILLPLGAALAGRTLPPLLRDRMRPARLRVPSRAVALALAAWLALGVAEQCFGAGWPSAPLPERSVADWLVTHHERTGLAGYWQADIITVATGGRVLVAPLTDRGAGPRRWQPQRWESSVSWFQPSQHRATFVIAVAGTAVAGAAAAGPAVAGPAVAGPAVAGPAVAGPAVVGTAGKHGGLTVAEARAEFGPAAARHRVGRYVVLTYRHNLLARIATPRFPGSR